MDERLKKTVEAYKSVAVFPDAMTVVVAFPKTEESNNEMDSFCIEALKILCPKADFRIDEYDFEEWGVIEVELELEDHAAEEMGKEFGSASIAETLQDFYLDVAIKCFEDEYEFREKRRRDRRKSSAEECASNYEQQLDKCQGDFFDMDDALRSLSIGLRDLSLLALGTEKEREAKAFRDRIGKMVEDSWWPYDELG